MNKEELLKILSKEGLRIPELNKNPKDLINVFGYYFDNGWIVYETDDRATVYRSSVFDTEEKANEAFALLQKGQDFYQVAADKANQDKETTNLGNVTTDSLLPELTEDAFDAKLNQVVGPINSEFGWHILKITNITPKKETPLSSVRNKIISLLQQIYKCKS